MKIDCWTHLMPPTYLRALEATGRDRPVPARFLLDHRALYDLDHRLRLMDAYGDYRQIVAPVPAPFLHLFDAESVRRSNEEMAEIVRRHPDQFAGFVAMTPIADPDAAAEEAIRGVRDLGALGVQLEEDPVNLPLHEDRYDPLFAAMADLGAGVWLHPCRTPATPGTPAETVPFLLWQVYGWAFDTTITVVRLILAGIYDRYPDLKLLAHHGGGLIPHFSGRAERMHAFTAMDPDLGDALGSLHRPLIDYFKLLYVDTALFGSPHAVRCVLDFFGPDHVLFGTDAPFDTEDGAHFIRATISDVEDAAPDEEARAAIFAGSARRLLAL